MSRLGTSRLPYGRPPIAWRRPARVALGLLFTGLLAVGCADKPPPPPKPIVTPVAMTLVAGADVNPDGSGRPSPLAVRVYALKSSNAFASADFFSLFDKDQATLGAEMVQREEMLLKPGDSKTLKMTLAADVKAIGVMAAYRDLERARWREVRVVEPGKEMTLDVTFGARRIGIDAK